ncbi:bifunctional enoyl-CoA hydratase/phosphate acetyltransferase [Entomobacter blattae]|uniref:Phosphate acetyltransferase n=1 Tax=Entomobacter blattae TaxID=2762277 RepID=A0A7H1NNU2_9PROT|nr:bifunctional enoyl-CoA hydratase/phosphate acetyltransferase [Entomobacter blattae]QNT77452.1 Phosphate acetyltransferase [Entomobacter blattae]
MFSQYKHSQNFINQAAAKQPISCAVAYPCDQSSLEGAVEAAKLGMIKPILVGPEQEIKAVAQQHGYDISQLEIIDMPNSVAAASQAVALVGEGKAHMLMKGSLHTDELMREVVSREGGLRTKRRISHVFVMDIPGFETPYFITDAAVNILPDLLTKVDIIQNAIDLHVALGLGKPHVAVLSAVETVYSKIPSTLEAAALSKMVERGQIVGGIVDGPLAMDNALSVEAARIKKVGGTVAGHAQILLAPNIEAGNMLFKALVFFAKASVAGVILGAKVPVVLTSRADSATSRLASCAVAALYGHHLQESKKKV